MSLSHFQICPKPKVKLGPVDFIYPAPPSSFEIATSRNPRQFGLTEMSGRSHRVRDANSLFPFRDVSVSPKGAIGPTEFARPTLCLLIAEIVLIGFMQSVTPR